MAEFDTALTADEETSFQAWKTKYAPKDSGADYDLRGAFKAGLEPDPQTGHWPDTYKKPNHPTFSDQSIYAKAAPDKAGHWDGDNYVAPISKKLAPGQKMLNDFKDAGYSDKMIAEIRAKRTAKAVAAGYSMKKIDDFWGDSPGVGTEVMKNLGKENLAKAGWEYNKLPMADPKDALDVFVASFGISTSGLRYRRPKEQVPPTADMSWGASFANAAGSLVGDAGDMLLGLVGGAAASGGNPVATGAAAMAYPEAVRQGYLYAHSKGEVSLSNIVEGMTQAPSEVAKAAAIGAVGGKAGSVAFNAAEKVAGPVIAGMAANLAGTVSATGVGAGLNGELPSIKEFTVAATMMALLPGTHYTLAQGLVKKVGARARTQFTDYGERVMDNLKSTWAKTGVKPIDAARIAEVVPVVKQALYSKDVDGQTITEGVWDRWKQQEPEPYKQKVEPKLEITGAMKDPSEPVEPLTVAGKVNPDTGIAPVKSVTPEQVDALVDFDAPVTPDQANVINDAARKYKNEDGSVDLEAVLVEHVAGEPAAQVFRASGRDYSTLDPKTQRFLEYAGKRLEEDGYAPEPKAGTGGGGDGKEPPGGSPKALGGPPEKPFDRAFEFVVEDVNSKVEVSPYATGWRGWLKRALGGLPDSDTAKKVGAAWRELSPLAGVDKMIGIGQRWGEIGIETIARLQYSADDRFMFRVKNGGGGYRVVTDKFGKPQYEANYDVPTMDSIMTRVDKLKHKREGFRAYMQARTTMDIHNLNKPVPNIGGKGKKTTTTIEEAMEIIAKVPEKERATYEELAHHYQRMMDDSLFGVMAHGGLDEEGFVKFKRERPNYFPQKVYIEPGKVAGQSRMKRMFQKAKGHDFVLKDQFLSTLETLQARERFNSANMARLNAVRELQKFFKAPGKDLAVYDPKTKKPTTLSLDEDGIPVTDKKFFDFKEGDSEIVYYEDGKQKSYSVPEFDGRDVFLNSLLSKNVFEKDIAVAFLSKPAKFARALIVVAPSYLYRMVVRDAFGHAALSKYGGAPYLNLMRGAFDILDTVMHGNISGGENLARGKAKYDEATLNGAVVGGIIAQDFNALLNSYSSIERTGFLGGVINSVEHPAQLLYRGLRMLDATVRVGGTYTGAREKFGALAASDMARKLGGDFPEKSAIQSLNQVAAITPFWTGFQRAGVDAVASMLKNDPTGFGLRGIKYMTIPAIALYATTEVLEDWYATPEPDRQRNRDRRMADNFMYVPIPWNGELHNFALPVPQGIGAMFVSPVHRIMRELRDKDPRAFKAWAWNVAFSFTGAAPALDNPVINSILEGASGWDFGANRPVVPARFEHVSGFNAYQPWTSEVAKKMSRWLGEPGMNIADISPITIEKTLTTFTGTVGQEGLRIIDAVVKENVPPKDWANTPILGSFWLRHPGTNAQPIIDFYDELDKFRNLEGDVTLAKKRGDFQAVMDARMRKAQEMNVNRTAEALRNMRAMANRIAEMKNHTPGKSDEDIANDKRQQIDNLATMMIAVSKSAVRQLDNFRWKKRTKELNEK